MDCGHITIRAFVETDREWLIDLWRRCGLVVAWNDPERDLDRKLADSAEGLVIALADGERVGSVMVGYDGHRGWVNYLAVDPLCRQRGLGRRLMEHAEAFLLDRGCPKLNLQIRASNEAVLAFYESLGYGRDAAVSLGKRLISDEEEDRSRSRKRSS